MPTHVKISINNFVGMLPEQPLAPFVQDCPILDIVKTNIQLRFKENIINLYFYYFNCRFTRSNSEMYWKTPIGHHTCAKNNCGIQIIVLFTKRKQHAILELTVLYNQVVLVKQYTPFMMQVIPEPYVVFYVSNYTAIYYLTKRYLFYVIDRTATCEFPLQNLK